MKTHSYLKLGILLILLLPCRILTAADTTLPTSLPPALEGKVTLAEFQTFLQWQQTTMKGPDWQAWQAARKKAQEQLRALQQEKHDREEAALLQNPEMKALRDRINNAFKSGKNHVQLQ